MADPTKEQDFVNTIKEILKRLSNLEGRGVGNNMTLHTNAEQRGINVINQNQTEMIRFGRVQETNTNPILDFESDGLAIFNSDNGNKLGMWVDFVKGMIFPVIPSSWQESSAFKTITSGTFASIYNTWSYAIPSVWVSFAVYIAVDSGTTAEIKVQVAGVDTGTTQVISDPSSSHLCYFKAQLSQAQFATGPIQFDLFVRRASGGGNVYVYPPRDLVFGNPHTLPASCWEVS